MKIAFIGGGNMAEAILAALIQAGLAEPAEIAVSDISAERLTYLLKKYEVSVAPENAQIIGGAEIVILAVKPQVLAAVMIGLKGRLAPEQLVVSIVAGKNLAALRQGLAHQRLIRSMPNTPAQIGQGMTVWMATPEVSEAQKDQAAAIFKVMGQELKVNEERYLDMATALSGSGPAYLFLFVESLVAAGEQLGFSAAEARQLVLQTIAGALQLLQQSGQSARELRRQVTSPGGTTAEAIGVFEGAGFQALVARAVRAAYDRAQKLAA
jgi:pyrroline-5-carboxylate reductase